jgi:glycerol-1-phosphate dehydrogenase [NAD(P)+]
MDGYASVGAALTLNDMKVTLNARVPYAIVAESTIVGTAPVDMIRSGYGDIVGKYSCLNDWKLAHLLLDEYFCDAVYNTVMDVVKQTEYTADALLARDPDAIGKLMEGLVVVGVMMSYVGNSRPASGSEHHLSHFFEITGLLDNRPYYLHGIDVLYSAAVTAALREKLLAINPPFDAFKLDRAAWEQDIHRIYTAAADGVIELQDKVGLYAKLDNAQFAKKWNEIRAILLEAPSKEKMESYVSSIGLDMKEFYKFYGEETVQNAIRYAKELKDRYTVLWICFALGVC